MCPAEAGGSPCCLWRLSLRPASPSAQPGFAHVRHSRNRKGIEGFGYSGFLRPPGPAAPGWCWALLSHPPLYIALPLTAISLSPVPGFPLTLAISRGRARGQATGEGESVLSKPRRTTVPEEKAAAHSLEETWQQPWGLEAAKGPVSSRLHRPGRLQASELPFLLAPCNLWRRPA